MSLALMGEERDTKFGLGKSNGGNAWKGTNDGLGVFECSKFCTCKFEGLIGLRSKEEESRC